MTDLRKEARGMPCMVRVPGICADGMHETTVLAHVRMAGLSGIALKAENILGSWCCSACHDGIDGRTKTPFSKLELRVWHLEGCIRTQHELIRAGKIKVV